MEWNTTSFFVIDANPGPGIEIWCDWVPSVDLDMQSDVQGQRHGQHLKIIANQDCVRIFEDLAPDIWEEILKMDTPLWFVLCGPSGALSRRRVHMVHADK